MSFRFHHARVIVSAWILGVALASLTFATAFAGSLGTNYPH
jgi:hypothetical protein